LIADRLPKLIHNLFALADGVTVAETTEHGQRVYTKPPDRRACEYLVNRILSRPTERVEHGGAVDVPAWELSNDELIGRLSAIVAALGYEVVPQANGRCVECASVGGNAQANGRCVE
jgi:hypothetical protein